MANSTLVSFGGAMLGVAATTIYTSPAGVTSTIRALTLCNTGAATSVSINILRSGGLVQELLNGYPLGAAGSAATYVCREALNQTLAPGDQIQGLSPGGTVQAIAAGVTTQ